ncbi:hypothetical protein CVT26_008137 [Gymnopilus dilepis]|uniref:Uncharacterized protein n=1 Tax=Gymnopilus dilepis TaxID=231916 RepID=A0A409W9B3_9AGAR|nr:hypothetical protein CVT26_008137 [Gymnopilus dilepis]
MSEILKEMDLPSILRMRKIVPNLTETKALWQALYEKYSNSLPKLFQLDKPISACTAEELERVLLRWQSTNDIWKSPSVTPTRVRKVETEVKVTCMRLLRGGRWLLMATQTGEVIYADLESPEIAVAQLIPRQSVPNQNNLNVHTNIDIEVDMLQSESGELAFNLALVESGNVGGVPSRVRVWSVVSTSEALEARLLSEFYLDRHLAFISSMSLHGPHMAFSALALLLGSSYTIIVKWDEVNNHGPPFGPSYPMKVFPSQLYHYVRLLPNARLFCVGESSGHGGAETNFNIFDFSKIQSVTELSAGTRVQPIWKEELSDAPFDEISQPFICASDIRFVFTIYDDGVCGIIIPNDMTTPQIVELGEETDEQGMRGTISYGYRKSVRILSSSVRSQATVSLALSTHSWPDDDAKEQASKCTYALHVVSDHFLASQPLFDESSGRVVVAGLGGLRQHIVDLA